MKEYIGVGQEIWICEPQPSITVPSLHIVLPGKDGRFYPACFRSDGMTSSTELIVVNGGLVSFERYEDASAFCQSVPCLHELAL